MKWYASTKDIARMGPFKSQAEAAKHTMVHLDRCTLINSGYVKKCNCSLRPAEGAFVWPEE